MNLEKLINEAGEINKLSNSIIEIEEELEFINDELLTANNINYKELEEDQAAAELNYFIQVDKLKKLLDKLI